MPRVDNLGPENFDLVVMYIYQLETLGQTQKAPLFEMFIYPGIFINDICDNLVVT